MTFDLRPLRREIAAEAIDGAIIQAEGLWRFLHAGDDEHAEAAMRRLVGFVKAATSEMNAVLAENKRLAAVHNASASVGENQVERAA